MEDVYKTFQVDEITVNALRGVTLTIMEGDFTAIMGVSGSGKTTLMNIIGCLDTPTSGTYLLDSHDVSSLDDDALSEVRNEMIGFVFQHYYLLPYATVLDNVLLPTLYRERHPVFRTRAPGHTSLEAVDKGAARDLLHLVGLADRAGFKPRQLSGGQQQRVAIARALVNNPRIIICDEPTGQLDSATAEEIMNVFTGLHQQGKTILLVTHDMNVAARADKILYIVDGKIVELDEQGKLSARGEADTSLSLPPAGE